MAGEPITLITPVPTVTVIAPTPIAAGIHTQPSFDVIELLPPAAGERLRQLRIRRDDAYAVTVPFAVVSEASAARTAAANVVKRLLAPAGEGGFNLREGDSRVTRERQRLEKAQDEFDRLQERQAARATAFQAASQGLANVEAWLRDGRPSGTTLEDHPTPDVKLNKGESVTDGILRLQRRARELKADRHRIASAPQPSSWAKQAVREQIAALAARGEPDVSLLTERGGNIVWPTVQVQVTIYNAQPGAVGYVEIPDMLAIEAWRNKDSLLKLLDGLIMAESDDAAALTDTDRQLRTAETTGDLLDIERQIASLVWRGQSEGLPCEHGADCSPQAVLGVVLVTVPRADAPQTSPGHAYDIVLGGRR